MKKIFFYFLITVFSLSLSAQLPDIGSLSDQQKRTYLKNLSASDRELILRELQGSASSNQPGLSPPIPCILPVPVVTRHCPASLSTTSSLYQS